MKNFYWKQFVTKYLNFRFWASSKQTLAKTEDTFFLFTILTEVQLLNELHGTSWKLLGIFECNLNTSLYSEFSNEVSSGYLVMELSGQCLMPQKPLAIGFKATCWILHIEYNVQESWSKTLRWRSSRLEVLVRVPFLLFVCFYWNEKHDLKSVISHVQRRENCFSCLSYLAKVSCWKQFVTILGRCAKESLVKML